jgi:CDP-6-deoxy-D-xylo-4-hexulose-3-dehydrase
MAVSILGNPAPLDELRSLCDARGLYLVEDNCESMGATLNGRSTGTFGHINTFSLFFSHHISTMEGGMVLTDDDELHQLCLCLRNHGWTRDQPAGSQLFEKREDDFFEAYRFILPGYNLRPTEISGAIGVVQLAKLDQLVAQRRDNAHFLDSLFAGDERFIRQREFGQSSWFAFTFILNPRLEIDRARVMAAMKDADIAYRIITGGCILRHDMIRHYDFDCAGPIENAGTVHDHGFFVGNHSFDLRPQIVKLHEVLDKAATQ